MSLWKDQKEDEKDSKKKKFRDRIKMFENEEKDDDKGRKKRRARGEEDDDINWLDPGRNEGSSWNVPPTRHERTEQTRKRMKTEKDDSKGPKNDHSWIWEGGGKKSKTAEESELQLQLETTVLQGNAQRLRKKKSQGNLNGSLGCNWIRD